MRIRAIIYSLLLTTLCVGCGGRRYMPQLEHLEAQVDSVPHLVSQALDSMPSRRFRGEPRALYALLKTQADYKCFVPITSDSLIRYATDYYDSNRKSNRAAMAWYSLGCVAVINPRDDNKPFAISKGGELKISNGTIN